MKTVKRIALIMLSVVMMLSMSAFAVDSPTKQIAKASLKKTSFTYNGKKQAPKASQVVVKAANGKKLSSKYYTVSIKKGKDVGTYTVTVKGKGKYKAYSQKLTYTIKKATQKISTNKSTVTVKASKVAKKAYSQKLTVKKKAGKVSYTSSNPSQVTVKKGKIVVAKGAKKGTYKITVKVTGAKNYKDAKKTITVKVK